jgi:hypothetical protein
MARDISPDVGGLAEILGHDGHIKSLLGSWTRAKDVATLWLIL